MTLSKESVLAPLLTCIKIPLVADFKSLLNPSRRNDNRASYLQTL